MVTWSGKGDPPLEKAEEAELLKHLKKLPVPLKIRKMNGVGNRHWPDRLILGPKGFSIWVEMKRKKHGALSAGQEELFTDLVDMGHSVIISDDGAQAALAVKYALAKHGVLKL